MRNAALTCAAALLVMCVVTQHARAQTPTLRLTPEGAVALALEHDLELKRDRFGPQMADVEVEMALTAWTPDLSASVFGGRSEAPVTSVVEQGPVLTDQQLSSEIALTQRLPWGSSYRISWGAARNENSSAVTRFLPELRSSLGATFVQPLLRGATFDAARAERGISLRTRVLADAELASAVASKKREVLYAYWTWVHVRDFLSVQRQSLAMAQALLDGNRSRVATGAMAAVDVIEPEAEVARRAEDILIAEKNVANAEERLRLHILDPTAPASDIELVPEPGADADARHVTPDATRRALAGRQDLRSLQTVIAIESINVRRFRNDALPDVSVLMNYSLRGAGGTELAANDRRSFSSVLDDLTGGRYPSWSVALAVSYPVGTSRAEAEAARASLRRGQREAELRAAEQRVVREVSAAVREVDTNYRRLEISAAAVALSERRLDAEQRKFASGLSTSFFVFQAQRDLSEAREAQLRSLLDYRLATVDVEAVQVIPLNRR